MLLPLPENRNRGRHRQVHRAPLPRPDVPQHGGAYKDVRPEPEGARAALSSPPAAGQLFGHQRARDVPPHAGAEAGRRRRARGIIVYLGLQAGFGGLCSISPCRGGVFLKREAFAVKKEGEKRRFFQGWEPASVDGTRSIRVGMAHLMPP